MRRRVLALTLLAVATPLAAAAVSDIQPGDVLNGICTLDFVFDGTGPRAGKVYIGTAAHCVDRIGESASTTGSAGFGTVVYIGDFAGDANGVPGVQLDFALIEVAPAFVGRVRPDVLGHPGMPNGVTSAATTSAGDRLIVSGWGMGFDATAATRENRSGVLVSDNAREYVADTLAVPGDSGGPLLHADGRALGTISQFAFTRLPPSTDTGPTVQGILAELATVGFPASIRLAS